MEIINRIPRMMAVARELRAEGSRVGFVPTMGALHEGHLSLMSLAREMCDKVVVSIFVNPTQFGPSEDFERYPRDIARDAELAFTREVDLIFAPSPEDMYPQGFSTYVVVEVLSEKLEGASRPGHFRGVTTVVNKLFNIVHPHFAFFGRKDAQQVIVIKRMVRELSMDVEIVVGPTLREEDGLALSSRNVYLSPEERKAATVLRRALERARTSYNGGERDSSRLITAMRNIIEAEPRARIDYLAITGVTNLNPVETIPTDRPILISLAVFIGKTRLIDNIVLNGDL
ncbi:MAG TPA: pantoate--beta-alanine ligase [Blastocatellia bacterium]|nr:pantoate--beta-alanine ligase [Blastocatellia bacterium]